LLRAQIIGTPRDLVWGHQASQQRGIGLALLLREGMPGWLKAVDDVLRGSLVPPAAANNTGAAAPAAADGAMAKTFAHTPWHDLTILLASLVLSTRRPAGVSPIIGG
jgi:hypothetical protein